MGRHRISSNELVEVLYQDFRAPLLAYVLRLAGNDRQFAEDVVQETMLRAWRNAEKLRQESGSPSPWLFTVARNLVIDDLRGRSARPREVDGTALETMSVADQSDRALTAMTIGVALRGLSAEHRTAIAQTYLCGRTISQAADALGIPEGTVKSRVYYALRALRQALQDLR